jgi:transposase-like protein
VVPQVRPTVSNRASSAPSATRRQVVPGRSGLTINKHRYWLWRAVDQNGTVLDILVQSRRDQHAAERFMQRVLDVEDGVEPRPIVTDKLASYVPAIKRAVLRSDHRRHKRLNNRAENKATVSGLGDGHQTRLIAAFRLS